MIFNTFYILNVINDKIIIEGYNTFTSPKRHFPNAVYYMEGRGTE